MTSSLPKVDNEYFELDRTDPTYSVLSGYADRIGNLLALPKASADPDLAGSLDDFLGAVYALIQAKRHGFKDRTTRAINIVPVKQRALKIAAGQVKTDGLWVAGFYFNNALFRTAVVQHRILQTIVGRDESVGDLQKTVKKGYPSWASDNLNLVHKEVNHLKHTPSGVSSQRVVKYDDALAAVGELLNLIETWMTPTP